MQAYHLMGERVKTRMHSPPEGQLHSCADFGGQYSKGNQDTDNYDCKGVHRLCSALNVL